MRPGVRGAADRLIPWIAVGVVAATAAAMRWPVVAPVALSAAAAATCALALARRPSRGLRLAVTAIAIWIFVGVAGALLLAGAPRSGFVFVIAVLFAAPALAIPWIYARTFDAGRGVWPDDP